MNMHAIASTALAGVFPETPVVIRVSAGYTTSPDGRQVPAYQPDLPANGRKQALAWGDIQRLNNLNVQGVTCKMYLSGNYEGVFRADQRGGDMILFGGHTYLVSAVLERWDSWCCVALTMQVAP